MKVIDFRFRPNTPEIINGIKNSTMFKAACEVIGFDQRKPQPLDEIVADLDAMGVELGVITGRDAETTYASRPTTTACSNSAALSQQVRGPLGHRSPQEDGRRARDREGRQGIRHEGYRHRSLSGHMPASDARFYPLYTKCCELDVPVFITMAPPPCVPGAILEYADPRDVDKVARDFPELTLIMSHGGYPFVDAAIYTCQRNANVYMDISEYERSPQVETYVKAMCTTISDKVLFASAHPFIELRDALDAYAAFPFTDEVRNKIMYENARKVLKLA